MVDVSRIVAMAAVKIEDRRIVDVAFGDEGRCVVDDGMRIPF